MKADRTVRKRTTKGKTTRKTAAKKTRTKAPKTSPKGSNGRPRRYENAEARTEARLATLLGELRAKGWIPGEIAEWDEPTTSYYYGLVCESNLQARSLVLAATALELLSANQPATVRQCMYLTVSAGLLPDTSGRSYDQIQRLILEMRRKNILSYSWVCDDCRTRIKSPSWADLTEYTEVFRDAYRRDFWSDMKFHCEIIIEKNTLAGTLAPVAEEYDLPISPLRGFCSESFAWSIAEVWRQTKKPIVVLFIADFDPSGWDLERDVKKKLCKLSGREIGPDLDWRRLAVLPEHFEQYSIRPLKVKANDSRGSAFVERFGPDCAETEAIPPAELRRILRTAVEDLIPQKQWQKLQEIEAIERETFNRFIDVMKNGMPATGDDQSE